VTQREEGLLPRLEAPQAEQPFWGYRRIWAYWRCGEHWPVHQQRLWRLMRAQPLLVPPPLRLRAKRTPTGSKPRPTTPHAWWGSARTKVLGAGFGWLYRVVVRDW
jgi:putative transposase